MQLVFARAAAAAALVLTSFSPTTDASAQTVSIATPAASVAPAPPVAPQRDHVSTHHGTAFKDPWFWLREKDSPPVLDYLQRENAYTAAVTQDIAPFADAL